MVYHKYNNTVSLIIIETYLNSFYGLKDTLNQA